VTRSGRGVDLVVGRAGSGKTHALAAAAAAWRADGYRPIGVATAARAAAELESTAGIPSTTLARFLLDCEQAPGGLLERRAVVARYDGRGRLHIGDTPATVRAAMVADWYAAQRAGEAAAMLALRRRDVAELNVRARALLVADGSVATGGVEAAGRTFAVGDR